MDRSLPGEPFALPDRFWRKVAVAGPDDHHRWIGAPLHGRAGQFYYNDRPYTAARLVWASAHGDPGPRVRVRHDRAKCRDLLCCNLRHLEAIPLAEPAADGAATRRLVRVTFSITPRDRARLDRLVASTRIPQGVLLERALRDLLGDTVFAAVAG